MLDRFRDCGLRVGLENLDLHKHGGVTIDEVVACLDEHDAPLIFDVQHAYEHDPSMEYARELVDRVSEVEHLHVSGERTFEDGSVNRHALVKHADNREAILGFIEELYADGFNRPMVIEGRYESVADVCEEAALLRAAAAGERRREKEPAE